jgi:DNA-directed RNA polymerase specialized sigma24 family protein
MFLPLAAVLILIIAIMFWRKRYEYEPKDMCNDSAEAEAAKEYYYKLLLDAGCVNKHKRNYSDIRIDMNVVFQESFFELISAVCNGSYRGGNQEIVSYFCTIFFRKLEEERLRREPIVLYEPKDMCNPATASAATKYYYELLLDAGCVRKHKRNYSNTRVDVDVVFQTSFEILLFLVCRDSFKGGNREIKSYFCTIFFRKLEIERRAINRSPILFSDITQPESDDDSHPDDVVTDQPTTESDQNIESDESMPPQGEEIPNSLLFEYLEAKEKEKDKKDVDCLELLRNKVLNGLGYKEISEKLGISESAARMRAHACRKKFKAFLCERVGILGHYQFDRLADFYKRYHSWINGVESELGKHFMKQIGLEKRCEIKTEKLLEKLNETPETEALARFKELYANEPKASYFLEIYQDIKTGQFMPLNTYYSESRKYMQLSRNCLGADLVMEIDLGTKSFSLNAAKLAKALNERTDFEEIIKLKKIFIQRPCIPFYLGIYFDVNSALFKVKPSKGRHINFKP